MKIKQTTTENQVFIVLSEEEYKEITKKEQQKAKAVYIVKENEDGKSNEC